jgi:CheY-like chemotaxis protein
MGNRMRNTASTSSVITRSRVLVVEDDPDAREIYEGMLGYSGYEVLTSGSIAEARRVASARRPDIVILDCHLPDGSGIDLIRSWRANHRMDRVPIVMVTAFSEDDIVAAATRAGADAFLVKPCSGDVLTTHLAQMLRSAGARTSKKPGGSLAVVPAIGQDRPLPKFYKHEGKLHARCRDCFRGSPVLGRRQSEAETRALDLGWGAREDGWSCPVCIERYRRYRPPTALRR